MHASQPKPTVPFTCFCLKKGFVNKTDFILKNLQYDPWNFTTVIVYM